MTSINLQFMLFLNPLSVHSRSILWRPGERKETRGNGESLHAGSIFGASDLSALG